LFDLLKEYKDFHTSDDESSIDPQVLNI